MAESMKGLKRSHRCTEVSSANNTKSKWLNNKNYYEGNLCVKV